MNEQNNNTIDGLNYIRDKIENMTKFNQVEILRILNKYKEITLNENKYGVHINLTDLSNNVIDELVVYINYVDKQEINLNEIETQKETYKNKYFKKDNKDISISIYN